MASIQKYSTQQGYRWLVKYDLGIEPTTGKRKTTTKRGFKTEREAKLFSSKMELSFYNGETVQTNKIIVKDFIEIWFNEYVKSGIKKSTISNRKTTSIPHIRRLLGGYHLKALNTRIIDEALLSLQSEGYKKGTIDTVHLTIRMILKSAYEKKLIATIPIANKPKFRKSMEELEIENLKEEYLEKEELNTLLDVISEERNEIDLEIFTTLAYTGMRIGELLALKWTDIDFENRTITVSKTIFRQENTISKYELTSPKTKASYRVIPMSQKVFQSLQDILIRYHELKTIGCLVHDENFVFIRTVGNFCGYPENRHPLLNRLRVYMRKAKITKEFTLHKFRHTFTSLMAEAEIDLVTIQKILGHEDSRITQKIYMHITQNHKQSAIRKLDKMMDL